MAFFGSSYKRRRVNTPIPLIGVPAKIQAENSWRSSYAGEDEYGLTDIEKQRQQIDGYNHYAIFDSKQSEIGGMSLRDGHVVYILGESQSANPFTFGTMWIIEFEDGVTSCAYYDELHPLKDDDFVDHFGKSLVFDARGNIYAIAERVKKQNMVGENRDRYIREEIEKFLLEKEEKLYDAVMKTIEYKEEEDKIKELREKVGVVKQDEEILDSSIPNIKGNIEETIGESVVENTPEPTTLDDLNRNEAFLDLLVVKMLDAYGEESKRWTEQDFVSHHDTQETYDVMVATLSELGMDDEAKAFGELSVEDKSDFTKLICEGISYDFTYTNRKEGEIEGKTDFDNIMAYISKAEEGLESRVKGAEITD